MHMRLGTAAGITALLVLVSACGGSSSGGVAAGGGPTSSPGFPSTASSPATVSSSSLPSFNRHGSTTASGSTLKLEADNFYFSPSIILGKPGQKVKLEIDNESGTEHNFTVKAQHVDLDLDAHSDKSATVTIPASGFVSFYCEYHQSSGMAGVLQTKS